MAWLHFFFGTTLSGKSVKFLRYSVDSHKRKYLRMILTFGNQCLSYFHSYVSYTVPHYKWSKIWLEPNTIVFYCANLNIFWKWIDSCIYLSCNSALEFRKEMISVRILMTFQNSLLTFSQIILISRWWLFHRYFTKVWDELGSYLELFWCLFSGNRRSLSNTIIIIKILIHNTFLFLYQ